MNDTVGKQYVGLRKDMKFLSSILYLPFICLTLANIVVGLKWSSSYPNGVMNYGSSLIVRWSYNLSENEIKEAENFALVLIEREKKTFSQQWQVLAVQIPVTGKYRWVDQSPNIRPISGGGVGLVIKNVTEQAYTRYRCTFLSGFSASKKILIPVIKDITRSPWPTTHYSWQTPTPSTHSPLPAGNVSVRLVGARNPLEGRVEILHNGEWGTICDDGWDIRDARVVCRMLGNRTAVRAVSRAYFGSGSGRIWLDDVNCLGNETSIFKCRHGGWGIHNCGHSEDAGVVCQDSIPSKIVSATSNVTVMCGSQVNLTCTALGAPSPTVKWIRNNKTLATGLSSARYIMNGIQLHQAGEYMCMASNAFGSSRKSTFVSVMHEPRNTVILFSVPHNAVSLGESVEITCKTDAYPQAKCEVFRRGSKLGESGYVISSIASDDFGPYNCSCSNRFGREQGTGTLTLYENPTIQILHPRSQDISETASFKIFCNASGNPQPNISWYQMGRSERAVAFGETLLVAKSSLDDEGTYICKANNGRYEVVDNATVRIIYRVPRFLTMPENITANEDLGRYLNIHCNITGYPEPNVTWHRLGKLEAIGYGKTLTLLSRWNNSGIYECVAQNGIGNAARARAFFQILHKPYSTKLTTNRDNNVVIGNTPINVICTTVANPPADHYDIYRDNKHVATSCSGLYVIAKAKSEDQGRYTCSPKNDLGLGANSSSMTLHVFGALSIVHSPRNKTVIEGQTLSLYCNASSSFHNIILSARIRWNKEEQPRGSLSDGNHLSLKHVQPKDAGVYKCVATNGIALPDFAKATVIVQYKPRGTTLHLSSGGIYIIANQKLVLVCKTVAVPPATSFSFYHEGVKIGQSSNGVLNIPSVSSSGNGTYSCFAQNSIGFGDNATIVLRFSECGISYYGTGSHHQPQIVGGSYSVHGAWPWQVQMGVTIGVQTYPHYCGGSIINRLWIVTAAHCVTLSTGQIPFATGAINITLGQHYLDRVESTEQNIPVQQVIVHRNYSRSTIDYDIALLKLQRPITFNKYVSPVCLPAFDFPNGTTCFVSGWGRTGLSLPASNVLQEAAIPLMSRATCNSIYFGRVTNRMRCAGTYRVNRGTCKGDSGGPLVCSKHGRWYLMGTTSWGRYGCADSGYPGVYVDMLYFNNWIKNITKLAD